ncbi:inner centromere protein-like [Procambarus clarkii]|uniref:inner centromere protein-like n=1 Tax=Procambarus clarkii TaxID=6728 RepID=UPI0037430867
MKLKLEFAKLEREQQEREAALKKEEKATKKEQQEREMALKEREATLLLEREREQLETRKRDLEIQREHSKQLADSALEYHRQELALQTTHHTRRQQATASLPIHKAENEIKDYKTQLLHNTNQWRNSNIDESLRTRIKHLNILKIDITSAPKPG